MNRHYHTPDPTINAQRMLDELDQLHYAACRLHHDHPDEGIGWQGMIAVSKPITDAANALMSRFPEIESQTFNRSWYDNQHRCTCGAEDIGRRTGKKIGHQPDCRVSG